MKIIKLFINVLVLGVLLISCAPANAPVVNTEYILTTDMRDGNFVYVGVNGNINGTVNPALQAKPGEKITVTLINSGYGQHDIVFPELNVKSDTLTQKGETTSVTFTVPDKDVALTYHDTTHARLGMSGVLLVGNAAPTQANGASMVSGASATGKTIQYTLESGLADGKMVFVGKGGAIDGQTNPDLRANVGDTVKVTLISGEGATHNIHVEGVNAQSEDVVGQGNSVVLEFSPDEDGTFAYYCNIPGHRQAGMEGKFIVGSGVSTNASNTTDTAALQMFPATPVLQKQFPPPWDQPMRTPWTSPATLPISLPRLGIADPKTCASTWKQSNFRANWLTARPIPIGRSTAKVPGPLIRVRVGDTVELHLKNSPDSLMTHSIDLHAVTGPGGGSVATQTQPGGESVVTFKTLKPGLFVYHCATPMVAQHISNGMYGMILVEPAGGLPPVDHEFYVMQGELYTSQPFGTSGALTGDTTKLLDEKPEYFVFNGASMALTSDAHALRANVGETVRIFFGVGGPNYTSSFHIIGEMFDRVYNLASLSTPPMVDVQTTLVPPGGATMVELKLEVPGRYILVDHALSRLQRGLAGYLYAEGDPNPDVFNPGSGN